MNTATDKVPNTSATAASSGSDLNGQAVRDACVTLRKRLTPVAARLLNASENEPLVFADNHVWLAQDPTRRVLFSALCNAAYVEQISLSATGYYRTPNLHFDMQTGRGHPFHYFAYGGAIVEVEVCGLTGEHRMLRVDILHDVGNSLAPSIDIGQVEGGFIQGAGWLTVEELVWNRDGRLLTTAPSTYKIPGFGDAPLDFRVALLQDAAQPEVIHGSKAVGEPPLMLGIGVVSALRHAISGFGSGEVELRLPATCEAVLLAVSLRG
jgi:xanthine dehydrogenase large subunit